jgi:hypothetical protein
LPPPNPVEITLREPFTVHTTDHEGEKVEVEIPRIVQENTKYNMDSLCKSDSKSFFSNGVA